MGSLDSNIGSEILLEVIMNNKFYRKFVYLFVIEFYGILFINYINQNIQPKIFKFT